MTKNELKNGMYVKLKDGTIEVVIGSKLMESDGSFNDLKYFNNDLTNMNNDSFDIVDVFVSTSPILFNENGFQRVWTRACTPQIGDIYYDKDYDRYVAIFRIDDDTNYPYEAFRYRKGDVATLDVEPYSQTEISGFKFIKNSDKLIGIGDLTRELCENGTI